MKSITINGNFLLVLCTLILTSCSTKPQESKKLEPSDLFESLKDATCTVLTDVGQGSGFFIDSNIVVTNFHVIDNASTVAIQLGKSEDKKEVFSCLTLDRGNDLAILKVNYKAHHFFRINEQIPSEGEEVFCISSPLGLDRTFSKGIVSGKQNINGSNLIQISVPISSGSSGSPIFNENGELIGVAKGGFKEGNDLNFCIPSGLLKNLLEFKSESAAFLYNKDYQLDKNQVNSSEVVSSNESSTPKSSKSSIVLLRADQMVYNYEIKNKLIQHARSQIMESVNMWDFELYELTKMPLERRDRKDHCIKYVLIYTRDKNFENTENGWVEVGNMDVHNWYTADLNYVDGVCIQNNLPKGYPRNVNYFETKKPNNPSYVQKWCD